MSTLRMGNVFRDGGMSGKNCDSSRPCSLIRCCNPRFDAGWERVMPVPMNATVRAPASNAAAWAAVSMPSARPATTGRLALQARLFTAGLGAFYSGRS